MKQYQDAVGCYRAALELQPNDAMCWLDLGEALLDAGNTTDAIESFSCALSLEPDCANTHISMAKGLCIMKKPAEAAEYLKAGIQLDSSKRDTFESEFPPVVGPLEMEYLRTLLT